MKLSKIIVMDPNQTINPFSWIKMIIRMVLKTINKWKAKKKELIKNIRYEEEDK
jgi:ABC-type dipeptide/oligopeptide/nickel transport system ATPase subunit